MTTMFTTSRRFVLSAAAFGLATLGLATAASARPVATAGIAVNTAASAGIQVNVRDHRTEPVRHDGWRTNDPYRSAFWRYDLNRNGVLDAGESRSYWLYMAGTGVYGQLSQDEAQSFGQLGGHFDVNRDGRLLGAERRGMDQLIDPSVSSWPAPSPIS